MNPAQPLVSIVCAAGPCVGALGRYHGALFPILRALEGHYRFEIVYLTADAADSIHGLAQLDPRIRVTPPPTASADDAALHAALELAGGAWVIVTDASQHPAEIVPQLLEQAKGTASVVEGVPASAAPATGWRRFRGSKTPTLRPWLLKRDALEALRTARERQQNLAAALAAIGAPHAELTYTPHPPALRRESLTASWLAEIRDTWRRAPLELFTTIGVSVLGIGVFLALWFAVQGLFAPGTVWFSWSYLIVLLHLLGGAILVALGKLGALAHRILERLDDAAAPAPIESLTADPLRQSKTAA
ncbi:MAG: hypothetical protein L0Y71_24670 [Gemmataceae bacterium]|nr:hypothetical protein [Gemmataceae bacterium]